MSTACCSPEAAEAMRGAPSVTVLTNFLPPYRVPLFRSLAGLLPGLRILVSTPMEPNRSWESGWEGLAVQVQQSLALRRRRRHPAGFSEETYLHFPLDTYRLLRRLRPAVVVSGELGCRSLLAALYRLSPAGRHSRLVLWATVSERTEAGRGVLRRLLRRALLTVADAVIVNGASGFRYVAHMGAKAARTFAVAYTADRRYYEPSPLARPGASARRLLYAGQLVERKGVQPFLVALRNWAASHPERTVEMWIAGDGPLVGWLESFEAPANLTLKVLGHVGQEELREIYRQCGVLVFPTLADEWGLVVNEAMASGMPVLGSQYSQAVEELVDDGVNGWVFAPDDGQATANALDRVFQVPAEHLDEMRQAARRRVEGLTPEWAAEQIVRVIEYVSKPGTAGS